jgi:adenine phosphoribosyltransferase
MSAGAPPPAVADVIARLVRDVPDVPEPGVMFKDISPLLADATAFAQVVDALAQSGRDESGGSAVDKVVGIEARGFILAAPVALALGAGFVPIRKAGKLPGETFAQSYALEYGEATLESHRDAFAPGEQVLVVDDVLATGGTIRATVSLIEKCGARVRSAAVLLELGFLGGRAATPGVRIDALTRV